MGNQPADYARSTHDHRQYGGGPNDLNRQSSPGRPPYHDLNAARNIGKYIQNIPFIFREGIEQSITP